VSAPLHQSDDARFAQVLSFPSAHELVRRLPPFIVGLWILGFSISMSVRADLGLAPWDVFHQGVAKAAHLSLGTVIVLVGLVVLVAWIPLRQRFGLGTLLNTISIGLIANLGLAVIPKQHSFVIRVGLLVIAIIGLSVGGGLYIGSGLGTGPRDGLMTAISARGYRLWVVRMLLECAVMVVGFVLGGRVGVGTVLIAFSLGPLTHAALRRFHMAVGPEAPEVMGE
jgi:uncharacterized membrane protein YczE